jgi:hypothetical protein
MFSLLAVTIMCAIVAGCSDTQQWVGMVTALQPTLCVGRHAALGDCFAGETLAELHKLHVGECVEVTYIPSRKPGPSRLKAIKQVPSSNDPLDCPKR